MVAMKDMQVADKCTGARPRPNDFRRCGQLGWSIHYSLWRINLGYRYALNPGILLAR